MSQQTESETALEGVLKFIREHAEIVLALNPYNMHQFDTLFEGSPIACNCCFWIPPLVCDILKLQAPKKGKRLSEDDKMTPGHYYFIECLNHELSILYLRSGDIWYIDYYVETGRDAPFRIEKISLEELNSFVGAARKNDLDTYSRFHKGNETYQKELALYLGYDRRPYWPLLEDIHEQELPVEKESLDLSELKRVIEEMAPSFPMSDFDEWDREFYNDDDFSNRPRKDLEKAIKRREAYMNLFRLLV